MKRQTILLLLLIAASISLYAFSNQKKIIKEHVTTSRWWDFIGTDPGQQSNNSYYILDPNNFPDCLPSGGTIFCEIYAETDPDSDPEDPKPDLYTITNQRMKYY